ncbi:hypothetical protein M976_01805 [Buttiauxella ferragutiae ATCC 51602]|jgi:major type 1 subunit fimbrin (pilin)|uniref:Fimbrial-type adhesion domain-containing protein n=1 Tax=Buttiauxella ferragutiae ATCC 51602 TaxID=1354252 RepID=A0ABX2W9V2_9ENTR|nr:MULTISPECIES: fimbrial protein [Buttiauxella]OAT28512.1 hypothetical protein M976_01805 [Buttiauxella ferragutiae ATCC 51602]
MKYFKLKLVAAALALGGMVSVANAADGSVHFTGEITETACNVTNGAGKIIPVALGKVAKTSLATVAAKSSSVPFTIDLDNCPDTNANIRFSGTADSVDKTLLAIDSTSVASGVAIEIDSDTGQKIAMYAPSTDFKLAAGKNKLKYQASYVATNSAVTAGSVVATSQFTIIYN